MVLATEPITDKYAETIAKVLLHTMNNFGIPEELQSDNGSEFSNRLLKAILDKAGIALVTARPRCAADGR